MEVAGEAVRLNVVCSRLSLDDRAVKLRIRQGRSVLEAIYETAGRKIKGQMLVDGMVLRQAREQSGLTLALIARRCDEQYDVQRTKHIIANIERSTHLVTPQEQEDLCTVL